MRRKRAEKRTPVQCKQAYADPAEHGTEELWGSKQGRLGPRRQKILRKRRRPAEVK